MSDFNDETMEFYIKTQVEAQKTICHVLKKYFRDISNHPGLHERDNYELLSTSAMKDLIVFYANLLHIMELVEASKSICKEDDKHG